MEEIAVHDQDRSLEEHTWHFNHFQRLSQSLTLCVIIPAPGFTANVRLRDLNRRRGETCCLPRKSSLTGRPRRHAEAVSFLLRTYLNIDVKQTRKSISM